MAAASDSQPLLLMLMALTGQLKEELAISDVSTRLLLLMLPLHLLTVRSRRTLCPTAIKSAKRRTCVCVRALCVCVCALCRLHYGFLHHINSVSQASNSAVSLELLSNTVGSGPHRQTVHPHDGDKIDVHSDSMTVPLQLLLLSPLLSLLSWFCASLLRHVVQPQNDSDGQLVAAAAADSVGGVRGWWSLWLLLSSIKVIVGKKRGRQAGRQEECTAECRRIIN